MFAERSMLVLDVSILIATEYFESCEHYIHIFTFHFKSLRIYNTNNNN